MLSRVANSMYWMGRYIERAENYARFIDVIKTLALELPPTLKEQWQPLVAMTGDSALYEAKYKSYTKTNVLKFLTVDGDNPNSVFSCISNARENARTIRDTITIEVWYQINELYLSVQNKQKKNVWTDHVLNEFLKEIINGSHLYTGIIHTTFSHEEAWNFSMLGRMLERADKIVRMVDMKYYYLLPKIELVGTPLDLLQWTSILKAASAYEMFRKNYPRLSADRILEFLLLNRNFPRSVKYCLSRAEESMNSITGSVHGQYSCKPEKEIGRLSAELSFVEPEEILKTGLHEYLIGLESSLNDIGLAITEKFFF
ncbi:MAG TPA: hypothetical protein DD381_04850 [Lentisphaeria bacterium]|nr:MAG: hypothetical protein A2X47_01760 [Lentisphaerae bacterium GWF2_38_69]HBM15658.1 hypothetical protein [Lentisphaeria bacterium]